MGGWRCRPSKLSKKGPGRQARRQGSPPGGALLARGTAEHTLDVCWKGLRLYDVGKKKILIVCFYRLIGGTVYAWWLRIPVDWLER